MSDAYVLKIVSGTKGSHVHVCVFTAEGRPERHGTFALCGTLTFRDDEWPAIQAAFRHGGVTHVLKEVR